MRMNTIQMLGIRLKVDSAIVRSKDMTRCFLRIRAIYLELILSVLLASCVSQKESPVLLLPQGEEDYDSLMRAGTREYFSLAGLSLVKPPNSSSAYYVIDRRTAARKMVMDNLARMSTRGFISIVQDQGLISRVVHLELNDSDSIAVRVLFFNQSLLSQVYEEMANKPLDSDRASVFEYVEYSFLASECEELPDSISLIDSALQGAAATIGVKPPLKPGKVEEVIVGGAGYLVQVRMQELIGTFNVGGNAGVLFEAVRSTLANVQDCTGSQKGVLRKFDFYG